MGRRGRGVPAAGWAADRRAGGRRTPRSPGGWGSEARAAGQRRAWTDVTEGWTSERPAAEAWTVLWARLGLGQLPSGSESRQPHRPLQPIEGSSSDHHTQRS